MNPCEICKKVCKYKSFTNCPTWQEWARKINENAENTSFEEEEITISL